MAGFGVKAYQQVAVDTQVGSANAHKMILLLFDGATEAISLAQNHLGARRIKAKCEALGKAVRIVEEGLKASVDRKAGGLLAERLVALYDYISMRLLQANLRNDAKALQEAHRLLADLRSAWAQIAQTPMPPSAVQAGRAATGVRAPAAPARIGR